MFQRFLPTLLLLWFGTTALFAQVAVVSGRVTTEAGQPLSNMAVDAYSLSGNLILSTRSNVQGNYHLTLSPASYRILAYDPSGTYATVFYPNSTSFDSSAVLTLTPTQPLTANFALPPGLRIRGTVRNQANNATLGRMVVAVYNLEGSRRGHTLTDSGGTYALVVPAGSYKVVAWDDNLVFVPEFYPQRQSFEQASTLEIRADRSGVDFTLSRGARMSGRVRERVTATAVSGITVTVYDLSGLVVTSAVTNATGEYALVVLPGTYKLSADDPEKRYQTSFFQNASSFASAATITVSNGDPIAQLDFLLEQFREEVITTLYIPGVANVHGVGTTFFKTDLWIQNPSESTELTVAVTFLEAEADNSSRVDVPVIVPARQQVQLTDVLQTLFGLEGTGALRLVSNMPFKAMSRTYNAPEDLSRLGTHGLAIPAQGIGASISLGTIAGLSNTAEFRSNVGVLNPQPHGITVKFELFNGKGTLIAEQSREFLPLEFFQANTIFSYLAASTLVENAYVRLSSTQGSFFAYGSVVDQTSGDGTLVPMVGD